MVHLVYTYLTGIQFDYKTYRDLSIRWCDLSTIPGTTPHCLVSTEGNVNFLGTRNLVYKGGCSSPEQIVNFIQIRIISINYCSMILQDSNYDCKNLLYGIIKVHMLMAKLLLYVRVQIIIANIHCMVLCGTVRYGQGPNHNCKYSLYGIVRYGTVRSGFKL